MDPFSFVGLLWMYRQHLHSPPLTVFTQQRCKPPYRHMGIHMHKPEYCISAVHCSHIHTTSGTIHCLKQQHSSFYIRLSSVAIACSSTVYKLWGGGCEVGNIDHEKGKYYQYFQNNIIPQTNSPAKWNNHTNHSLLKRIYQTSSSMWTWCKSLLTVTVHWAGAALAVRLRSCWNNENTSCVPNEMTWHGLAINTGACWRALWVEYSAAGCQYAWNAHRTECWPETNRWHAGIWQRGGQSSLPTVLCDTCWQA